jgi:hypothetical protein
MKRNNRKVHRLAKLRVMDFETVAATERRQQDMLRRLERTQFGAGRLAGCDKKHCGRKKCSEVCQFGTRRRRLKEIPAVHRLLRKSPGPLYEVRVGRGGWAQPAGKLNRVSIAAAKKLNRWALDRLYYPGLIAVGTFKVSVAPKHEGSGWKCEIHQIISGAKKKELEKVFSSSRPAAGNFLLVKEVINLGQTISDVLKRDVQGWQHPYRTEITPDRPKKLRRAEYYEWLLGLSADERMIRYSCDRYFNQLKKKPRVVRVKVSKKRPYPRHLYPHMFGTHPMNCKCDRCMVSGSPIPLL